MPGQREFFWIGVEQNKQIIACIASRLFTGDLGSLLHTRSIWGMESPTLGR